MLRRSPFLTLSVPACCLWLQVLQWVMSYDGTHTPEALAITAASAALLVSGAAGRL